MTKSVVGDRDEVAALEGGGDFADYTLVSLYCLRIYLDESYRSAPDLLNEMPHILAEISLEESDFPDHSTLARAFDRFQMKIWRVLLRLSAQLHDLSGHAAIDATFFDRKNVGKHYCRRTNYHVQTLKATALVDTQTQAILDVHCTTEKTRNTQLGWQVACHSAGDLYSLAVDKGYNWMQLCEKLREEGVRPLIKHRTFRPIGHAYNARVDGPRYRQRSVRETVFSSIKCMYGGAVRA